MPFLIYQLKLAAVFLLLYMFFRLFLMKETLHSFNRLVVLLSMLISTVLPACVIAIHVDAAPLPSSVLYEAPAVTTEGRSFSWAALLLAIYFAGAAAVLFSVLVSIISLMRLISRGERLDQSDGTVVVLVDEPVAPMSWMKFIILSREDYCSDSTAIMVHEKAHIRFGHSFDVLLADLFTAMQWFNPAAWMMREDLRAIHEYEADEEVIKSGIDVKQYQLLLVKKAFGASGRSVSNNFNHGKLKKRITMMSIKKSSAFKALKFLYVLPVVCAGLAVNARPVYDSPEKCAESYKLSGDITISVAGDSVSVAEFLPDNVDVYVDGRAVSRKDLGTLDPEKISSVNVIKTGDGNAIQVFTVAYSTETDAPKKDLNIRILESGDSELATAGTVKSIHVVGKDGVKIEGKEQPDFYVDGEKVSYESFREMSPDDFESIVVSKPDGPDGKGRIDITTKK